MEYGFYSFNLYKMQFRSPASKNYVGHTVTITDWITLKAAAEIVSDLPSYASCVTVPLQK